MKEVSVAGIAEQVRVVLDENMCSTPLADLEDVDTLSLDELIESKIEPAARMVVEQAPLRLLSDASSSATGSLQINATFPFHGSFALPTDFLRLVSFKLESWPYPVHESIDPTSGLYVQAHSPWGVYGTPERPVVCVTVGAGGANKLEFFSANGSSDGLAHCYYVKVPKIGPSTESPGAVGEGDPATESPGAVGEDVIGLGAHLVHPTVYCTAYLVALSLQEKEAAERLLGVCNELMRLR